MTRSKQNWISAACGLVYILCYLFLGFYNVAFYPLTGKILIKLNAIMSLPLIIGVLLIVAPIVLEPKISLIIGLASLGVTLLMMLLGGTILGAQLSSIIGSGSIGSLASSFLTPDFGSILCLILCMIHLVFEYSQNNNKPVQVRQEDDFFA